MNILVVLPRFPYPLEKGDKLRAYHQLRVLSQFHTLYLVTLNEVSLSTVDIAHVQRYCKEIHVIQLTPFSKLIHLVRCFFSGLPLQCGYFYKNEARRTILDIVERIKPDRIYCQLIRVAEYVKDIPIPKTLDYQDVLSKGMQRRAEQAPFYKKPLFNFEYKRLLRYEEKIFSSFDHKVIITEVDRDLIPHIENETIHIIANGVDFEQYKYQDGEKEYDLLFAGNMNYPPNIEAAEYLAKQVFPILQKEFPDLTLVICGTNPTSKVKALQNKHIIVTGWVESMAEYYAKSRIFIAPMHLGTGLQNKLLEAMSMKLPCITSTLAGNPLRGIESEKEIIICNTTTGYVEMVKFLLQNPEKRAEIGENGYQFVKRNYNWETINEQLAKIITS
ncbi:MAG TPA: glycosyltransferase [Bacteroidales bacterium]|nr:glycosyltransferase [Bacteroidales bacterium]